MDGDSYLVRPVKYQQEASFLQSTGWCFMWSVCVERIRNISGDFLLLFDMFLLGGSGVRYQLTRFLSCKFYLIWPYLSSYVWPRPTQNTQGFGDFDKSVERKKRCKISDIGNRNVGINLLWFSMSELSYCNFLTADPEMYINFYKLGLFTNFTNSTQMNAIWYNLCVILIAW